MIALETVRGRFPNRPRTAATGFRLQVSCRARPYEPRSGCAYALPYVIPAGAGMTYGKRRRPVGDSGPLLSASAFTRTRVALCTIGYYENANLYIRIASASLMSVDLQGCRTPWRAFRAAS